jgi:NAD-dependent dihydropyrimidine dehydrogenase PreA subunit/flavodoxin
VKGSFPIFYFSGTGNTWWISQHIAKALLEQGLDVQAYSIEQIEPQAAGKLIEKAVGVGLGFPIYGSDVPRIFKNWLDALPAQKEEKPTLGFITQGLWSGTGCNFLDKYLKEKGLDLQWSREFNMPNNICLPKFAFMFPYESEPEKWARTLENRQKDVQAFAAKVAGDIGYRQHNDVVSRASAWIQRGPFRLMHDPGRKLWSVDENCLGEKCARCTRICPVENIKMVDGIAQHGEACVYCMRCFNYCPTHAIHYWGASNKKLERKPPYQGPVKTYRPELICRSKS